MFYKTSRLSGRPRVHVIGISRSSVAYPRTHRVDDVVECDCDGVECLCVVLRVAPQSLYRPLARLQLLLAPLLHRRRRRRHQVGHLLGVPRVVRLSLFGTVWKGLTMIRCWNHYLDYKFENCFLTEMSKGMGQIFLPRWLDGLSPRVHSLIFLPSLQNEFQLYSLQLVVSCGSTCIDSNSQAKLFLSLHILSANQLQGD